MIKLTQNDWRIFRRLQRKHKVSTEFLRYNLENIEKFIWFETWPRIVIRRYAIRKGNRVFIIYYRLRRVLFDQSNSKIFKRMRQNIKQWSKRIVAWRKNHFGIEEYVEEVVYDEDKAKETQETESEYAESQFNSNEDVSRQLKEQLEILKSGRRPQPLITNATQEDQSKSVEQENQFADENSCKSHEEKQKSDRNIVNDVCSNTNSGLNGENAQEPSRHSENPDDWQVNLESTPEKQITTKENMQPVKQLDTDEKTEKSQTEPNTQHTEKIKTGLNFLDMLMCKVSGSAVNNTQTTPPKAKESLQRMPSQSSMKEGYQHHNEHSLDSTDEFLGFEDCERIPGMLMTPIVPHSTKNGKNSVFVSESLNEYMRANDLETNYSIDEDRSVSKGKIYARNMEGLMTPNTSPPHFDMPAVPENLLKYRTVAERKHYLQKCSKNHRLAIINNEAIIYRELQRRIRLQKVKSASQVLAQAPNSSMSFTRNGWKAASFINTEFNKYYYQILDVDHGTYKVRLRGARGNNDDFHKTPYISRVIEPTKECSVYCADDKVWQYLKPIKTIAEQNKKLNRNSLPSVFKPCPLSHKTFQKPLDDDTAALLLAGGSMAVVRMPTVELEVFPEYGKPLHEIAKRYLQYILPHHDISREWAEFSVSTLQQPKTLKEAEQAAAKHLNSCETRKSYTFVIPYQNDRNHILVRRVVDRSEKLDESFEHCVEDKELVPKTDFAFRRNLDLKDELLQTCADVVSDMINTVAISCSENSFIKTDPDGLNTDNLLKNKLLENFKPDGAERTVAASANNTVLCGGNSKKPKKQNSLLMELKRLNATIIDAAVKPETDNKPCCKEYCQMGCICVSLKESVPMRQHCGKTKCMLECTCKPSSNQSRIMRLETEGRTLTTEDAFMLRRKATARLARMEKEFTSTIVLTENETLLINETNNDKKRRCTKAPKRYEDFTDTEDERKNSPKKAAMTTIDKEKNLATEIQDIYEPVFVEDTTLEQLKHCTVNLVPLQEMDNIAPWCMVHNLYKCFCKGRATEGKPMIIEKEEANHTIEHETQKLKEFDHTVGGKAKYTFEKVEKEKSYSVNEEEEQSADEDNASGDDDDDDEEDDDQDDNEDDEDWAKNRKLKRKSNGEKTVQSVVEQPKTDEESEESVENENMKDIFPQTQQNNETHKPRRNLHDVRKRFYSPRLESCRRHIPTPRRMFLYCNRRRRLNVLKYIKENENDRTRLLLNEHIMRSVYYHINDMENNKKYKALNESSEKKDNSIGQVPQTVLPEKQPTSDLSKKKFLLVNEIVDLLEDEADCTDSSKNSDKNKDDKSQIPSSTSKRDSPFEKILPDSESNDSTNHFQICSSGGVITVKKCDTDINPQNKEELVPQTATPPTTSSSSLQNDPVEIKQPEADTASSLSELKLPKISSCFSLNINANVPKSSPNVKVNEEQCLDFSSATSVNSAAFSQSQATKISSSPMSTECYKDTANSTSLDLNNESVRDVYNTVIKTMNSLVSKKMQDIDCALQRESHIIPTPNADILCIMKWCNFLDAFCEGFAYIWQVKLKSSTFFAITIQNIMPLIIGAMGIVNITALKADKLPLMGRMLLQKFRNNQTETLAVVMQGKQTHWVVKGFLKSDPSTACNKPTPETHPLLTKKINVLCSLLVKQRQRDQKKKERSLNTNPSSSVQTIPQTVILKNAAQFKQQPTPPLPQTTQTPAAPKVAQILPTRRIVTIKPRTLQKTVGAIGATQQLLEQRPSLPQQHPLPQQITQKVDAQSTQNALKQNEMDSGKVGDKQPSRKRKIDNDPSNNVLKVDKYIKMSSNIEFRSVTQNDIDEIFLPEIHKLDHKWLVLDLHNDFSHIFVPEFRDLVSLDRIQKVINFARQKSKIVKLQFFQNAPFDAFVTPKSIRKIYFGPLTMEMKGPTLILLQSVDGQMMLRELYQLQHNIQKNTEERTKAFWLVHHKGQTHFEMDVRLKDNQTTATENCLIDTTPSTTLTRGIINTATSTNIEPTNTIASEEREKSFINQSNHDDDEDCIIIDDEAENCSSKDVAHVLPQTNSSNLSLVSPVQISKDPAPNKVDVQVVPRTTQRFLKVTKAGTIIKPLSGSNCVEPVAINMSPITPTSQPLSILTLPPNTIITGINPSPATPVTNVTPITNVTPTQFVNIPKTALITSIETAPPEAPFSSTIYLSSSPSSTITSMVAATTTSAAFAGSTTVTSAAPLEKTLIHSSESFAGTKQPFNTVRHVLKTASITSVSATITPAINTVGTMTAATTPLEAKTVQSNEASGKFKNSFKTIRQALEAGPIKRRRISLFCPNKYDKTSENLAVDALRKILPENTEDIHISPAGEETNVAPTNDSEVVATVGSTKISKIPSHAETNTEQTPTPSSNIESTPIVFDVNFMDDGDEPTASIVIKPTSSASTTTTTITTEKTSSRSFSVNPTTAKPSILTNLPATTPIIVHSGTKTSMQTGLTNAAPPNKKIKLSTVLNRTNAAAICGNVTVNAHGKLVNSLLSTKPQGNNISRLSSPVPIAPKMSSTFTITNASVPSANSTSTATTLPFRPSVSLKVQKIVNPTTTATLQQTSITTSARAKLVTTPTLTVKQVQDMLKKSCANVTSVNSTTLTSPAPINLPATTSLQITPSIRASIAPVKITAVSTNSAAMRTENAASLPTKCIATTSPVTTQVSAAPASITTAALNTTLTISKVQSFGAPQKTQNPENSLPTLNTPPVQIVVSDLNEKVLTPTPPPHIQYGYIVSAPHANHKYVAKRVAEEFYVKVPTVGILKLQGLTAVNNYLNKYISKTLKETTPATWQFVAASKAVQMQNHQKSLLVRKTKNTNSSAGTSKNSNLDANNSLDEPILIDD